MPGPYGILVPPVFVPGTPDNDVFTKGTLGIIKGIGGLLDDMFGGAEEPDDDPNTRQAEHTTNKTPSNLPKHEKGEARRQRDQGEEKKEKNGRSKKNPNKRRQSLLDIDEDFDTVAYTQTTHEEEIL
jgi:hypothetical protein